MMILYCSLMSPPDEKYAEEIVSYEQVLYAAKLSLTQLSGKPIDQTSKSFNHNLAEWVSF